MPKVLMVAHWDWVLYNFRLPLARVLREKGFEVTFVCPWGEYAHKLKGEGFRWICWSVTRKGLNPVRELASIFHLAHIYREENPHIVHHFTIKPNLFGSIAAILSGTEKVISTFTGLGFLFSEHALARCLRIGILPIARWAFKSSKGWSVFQNYEDLATLLEMRLILPERATVIASSGVDVERFRPVNDQTANDNGRVPIVLMAGRLLWDKGVGEFVEAARILKERKAPVEFWLAGKPDDGNPACVPEDIVKQWHGSGLICWLGHCDDMPNLLRQVSIAVLPSYHEGVPRFLLEAAATGLPLVATDIEGCRMVVRQGENGFLVPVRDVEALADAIETLVRDPKLRLKMGKASREIAVREFDERKILEQWLKLYERILAS